MGWDVDALCATSVIKPPGINEAVLRFRGYTDKGEGSWQGKVREEED
jgi:hypothetical protein